SAPAHPESESSDDDRDPDEQCGEVLLGDLLRQVSKPVEPGDERHQNGILGQGLTRIVAPARPRHTFFYTGAARVENELLERGAVARAFAAIGERFGRVDLLANCAGRSMLVPFLEMTDADLDWVLGPNLLGVVHCIRAAVPLMPRGSRIVNVSSVSGRIPTPGEALYSACKAAGVSLSEALEAELASRGIGVTVVLPGEMSTALFAEHPSWERRPAWQRRMEIPPERVAEAIVRAVGRDRFEVVDRASMRAALLVQRAA